MMKVLCFGDSLTKGDVGVDYINQLARHYPDSKFIRRGTNGDTLNIISKKVIGHLRKVNDYDFIILQGGANDILLPSFKQRGGLFKFAYDSQVKKGLVPLETTADYFNCLKNTFKQIKGLYRGKIIFITIGCLNEKLDTPLNKMRIEYNAAIRKAAREEQILLADIEPPVEHLLKDKKQTDYLIENFWGVTITDRILSAFKKGPVLLSKIRKLHLTVDGAHVNALGAMIVTETIKNIIDKEKLFLIAPK